MSEDFSFEVKRVENGYILKCRYRTVDRPYYLTYCYSNFSDVQARIDEILEELSKEEEE